MLGGACTFASVNSCAQAAPGALLAVYCSAHAAPVAGDGALQGRLEAAALGVLVCPAARLPCGHRRPLDAGMAAVSSIKLLDPRR